VTHSIGSHHEDYPPREVEAARRVMMERWQVLDDWSCF